MSTVGWTDVVRSRDDDLVPSVGGCVVGAAAPSFDDVSAQFESALNSEVAKKNAMSAQTKADAKKKAKTYGAMIPVMAPYFEAMADGLAVISDVVDWLYGDPGWNSPEAIEQARNNFARVLQYGLPPLDFWSDVDAGADGYQKRLQSSQIDVLVEADAYASGSGIATEFGKAAFKNMENPTVSAFWSTDAVPAAPSIVPVAQVRQWLTPWQAMYIGAVWAAEYNAPLDLVQKAAVAQAERQRSFMKQDPYRPGKILDTEHSAREIGEALAEVLMTARMAASQNSRLLTKIYVAPKVATSAQGAGARAAAALKGKQIGTATVQTQGPASLARVFGPASQAKPATISPKSDVSVQRVLEQRTLFPYVFAVLDWIDSGVAKPKPVTTPVAVKPAATTAAKPAAARKAAATRAKVSGMEGNEWEAGMPALVDAVDVESGAEFGSDGGHEDQVGSWEDVRIPMPVDGVYIHPRRQMRLTAEEQRAFLASLP